MLAAYAAAAAMFSPSSWSPALPCASRTASGLHPTYLTIISLSDAARAVAPPSVGPMKTRDDRFLPTIVRVARSLFHFTSFN